MTFKELLNSVTFDEVVPCLLQMHPDAEGNLKWYKIHFDMLRLMIPKYDDDANSDVCNITMEKWRNGKMILDAHPMEGDLWEHSLTKEIILAPDVKATNAEIAACCLWHTSFYGFVEKQAQECLRFDEDDLDIKDRWDDSIYNKAKAMRYFSIIRRNGGHVPTMKELSSSKKRELVRRAKEDFWYSSREMNTIKKKRMVRREFRGLSYERMVAISKFIVQAIPALRDESNNMTIDHLC